MSAKGITTLQHPVRPAVLIPYLGQIGIALAALASVPMGVAAVVGDGTALWRYLAVVAALLAAAIPMSRRPRPADMQPNEGLVITATVFVLSPFVMAFPLSSSGLSYGQGLFEAVSAVTTTGLSTLSSVEGRPASFLFARAWMQWYGGLGIVALLPLWIEPGPAARRLLGLDRPEGEDPMTSARFYARRILIAYLVLTSGGFLLLWLLGTPLFTALVHTLAAVSTGGFSSLDAGLAALNRPAALGVVVLSVLGAVPFVAYLHGAHGGRRRLFRDPQVRALLAAGLLGTAGLAWLLHRSQTPDWSAAVYHAGVLAFSAQTTSGFSTLDPGTLGAGAKYLLILMMASGGCLGSTAGGIKLIRLLIFFRLVQLLVQRTSLPRAAWVAPRLGGLELDGDISLRALLLILLFVVTIALSWLPFLVAGWDPLDALFEVVSAVATTGLSAGVSQVGLAPALQAILCLDMWLGRLEILAMLVLFSPAVWHHHRHGPT